MAGNGGHLVAGACPVDAMTALTLEHPGQPNSRIVIGQRQGGDVWVVLFVRLRDEVTLDDDLRDRIRRAVRSGATPRHMPSVVAQVADIPRTRSGKMVELAVRAVVHGEEAKNIEALANPEALDYFANHPDVV